VRAGQDGVGGGAGARGEGPGSGGAHARARSARGARPALRAAPRGPAVGWRVQQGGADAAGRAGAAGARAGAGGGEQGSRGARGADGAGLGAQGRAPPRAARDRRGPAQRPPHPARPRPRVAPPPRGAATCAAMSSRWLGPAALARRRDASRAFWCRPRRCGRRRKTWFRSSSWRRRRRRLRRCARSSSGSSSSTSATFRAVRPRPPAAVSGAAWRRAQARSLCSVQWCWGSAGLGFAVCIEVGWRWKRERR